MVKVLLLVVIFVLAVFIGISINSYFTNRKKFFQEFSNFLEYLKIQVSFQKSKIKQLVEEYKKQNIDENFMKLLDDYLLYLTNLNAEVPFEVKLDILKENEKSIISRVFMSIGRFNSDGEVANIHNALKEANSLLIDAQENQKKYGAVSVKLSIALGLLLIIVII